GTGDEEAVVIVAFTLGSTVVEELIPVPVAVAVADAVPVPLAYGPGVGASTQSQGPVPVWMCELLQYGFSQVKLEELDAPVISGAATEPVPVAKEVLVVEFPLGNAAVMGSELVDALLDDVEEAVVEDAMLDVAEVVVVAETTAVPVAVA
ncbi:hypothetical protein LTR60_006934, partial [Cryomyces antarcticus]